MFNSCAGAGRPIEKNVNENETNQVKDSKRTINDDVRLCRRREYIMVVSYILNDQNEFIFILSII